MPLTAQQIAEKSSAALGAHDAASHALGLQVTHIAPGQANVTMQVTEQMLNALVRDAEERKQIVAFMQQMQESQAQAPQPME